MGEKRSERWKTTSKYELDDDSSVNSGGGDEGNHGVRKKKAPFADLFMSVCMVTRLPKIQRLLIKQTLSENHLAIINARFPSMSALRTIHLVDQNIDVQYVHVLMNGINRSYLSSSSSSSSSSMLSISSCGGIQELVFLRCHFENESFLDFCHLLHQGTEPETVQDQQSKPSSSSQQQKQDNRYCLLQNIELKHCSGLNCLRFKNTATYNHDNDSCQAHSSSLDAFLSALLSLSSSLQRVAMIANDWAYSNHGTISTSVMESTTTSLINTPTSGQQQQQQHQEEEEGTQAYHRPPSRKYFAERWSNWMSNPNNTCQVLKLQEHWLLRRHPSPFTISSFIRVARNNDFDVDDDAGEDNSTDTTNRLMKRALLWGGASSSSASCLPLGNIYLQKLCLSHLNWEDTDLALLISAFVPSSYLSTKSATGEDDDAQRKQQQQQEEACQYRHHLIELDLSYNRIQGMTDEFDIFCQIFIQAPSSPLQIMHLKHNQICQTKSLGRALASHNGSNNTLKVLTIHGNVVFEHLYGAKPLLDALSPSSPVTETEPIVSSSSSSLVQPSLPATTQRGKNSPCPSSTIIPCRIEKLSLDRPSPPWSTSLIYDQIRYHTFLNWAGKQFLWQGRPVPTLRKTGKDGRRNDDKNGIDSCKKDSTTSKMLPLSVWPILLSRVISKDRTKKENTTNSSNANLYAATRKKKKKKNHIVENNNFIVNTSKYHDPKHISSVLFYLLTQGPVLLARGGGEGHS